MDVGALAGVRANREAGSARMNDSSGEVPPPPRLPDSVFELRSAAAPRLHRERGRRQPITGQISAPTHPPSPSPASPDFDFAKSSSFFLHVSLLLLLS